MYMSMGIGFQLCAFMSVYTCVRAYVRGVFMYFCVCVRVCVCVCVCVNDFQLIVASTLSGQYHNCLDQHW